MDRSSSALGAAGRGSRPWLLSAAAARSGSGLEHRAMLGGGGGRRYSAVLKASRLAGASGGTLPLGVLIL